MVLANPRISSPCNWILLGNFFSTFKRVNPPGSKAALTIAPRRAYLPLIPPSMVMPLPKRESISAPITLLKKRDSKTGSMSIFVNKASRNFSLSSGVALARKFFKLASIFPSLAKVSRDATDTEKTRGV